MTFEKEKYAVAVGNFDGVHIGHAALISTARSLARATGGKVAVFTFDGFAPKGSSKHLITPEQRSEILRSMGVDKIFSRPFEALRDMSPAQFCRQILALQCGASYVVCGYNFRFGAGAEGDADTLCSELRELGIGAAVHDEVRYGGLPVSSTAIRKLLSEGRADHAEKLLGRPFSLCLPVVHGNHIGTGLGFPTINQNYPDDITPLCRGVYYCLVHIDGKTYRAVTNVGVKPTVGSDRVTVESHVLDCDMDLYGKTVKTEFKSYLRGERRFDSLDGLKAQIAKDVDAVREIK